MNFWVKFHGTPPERWQAKDFEEFWLRLRDTMIAPIGGVSLMLDWVISDKEIRR